MVINRVTRHVMYPAKGLLGPRHCDVANVPNIVCHSSCLHLSFYTIAVVLMKEEGSDLDGILSDCLSDAHEPVNHDNHNAEFYDFVRISTHD